MSEKPLLIANWKIGLDHEQSVVLAGQIANSAKEFSKVLHIVLCPSALSLQAVHQTLQECPEIELGAQNMYYKERGAFTGETSVVSLRQLNVKYCIIGHSERRKHFSETDLDVAYKTTLALKYSMVPIVCIGETYEERQSQQAEIVVTKQLKEALRNVSPKNGQRIIIAYEPIWAIGTGQAINPEQAKMMGMVIRQQLVDMFPENALSQFRVVYGGSVDGDNVKDFIDGRVVSGVLVGGASQSFQTFSSMVRAFSKK